ncbi:MAG: carboxylesterase/lipase family protein [Kofleriaceae bacterium]
MNPVVETTSGRVRGKERRGIATWRGIPYATAQRFRAPEPVKPWAGERDAIEFGPFAMQALDPRQAMMSGLTDRIATSEDCHFLNVYSPGTDGKRPVVVWIHGGAFIMGAGSQPLYDGTSFAANHDIVVVTINYRLGLFGLMFLGDVVSDEHPGNLALLDQVAALRWVRDNIAAFGGDPNSVTIMGESAGAVSVAHLLAMPAAAGLFHRAILQSGAPGLVTRTREEATTFARDIIGGLGLAPRELSAVTADQLIGAQLQATRTRGLGAFTPYVDGTVIPRDPVDLVRGGSAPGVPVLLGSNRDEWALFDVFLGHALTQLVIGQLREHLGPLLPPLFAKSRDARADRNEQRAWVDLIGELAFRIPMIKLAEALLYHSPVWMYRFDWATKTFDGKLGAAHALELPFVWNVIDSPFAQLLLGPEAPTARSLATKMHAMWAAFIRGGNPGAAWPRYDTKRRATMIFDRESGIADDPSGELRALWP